VSDLSKVVVSISQIISGRLLSGQFGLVVVAVKLYSIDYLVLNIRIFE